MFLRKYLSPVTARVVPFLLFVAFTVAQGQFGAESAYWFYFAKTLVGAWLLFEIWPLIPEMRWSFSWPAMLVGVGIFAVWVGLDGFYPHTGEVFQNYVFPFLKKIGLGFLCSESKPETPWNPPAQFGQDSTLSWLFIITRIAGSTLVVPPLEEVFYRSFVYRYIASANFLNVPLDKFLPVPFLVTALGFGFAHNEWLAGILCGAAYQWLVLRKGRLGDAMTAHAITNFLLGIWVVTRGEWRFW